MQNIWDAIQGEPGLTVAEIAKRLDVYTPAVHHMLLTMDFNGYLLSEDDAGRLYPFGLLSAEAQP